MKKPVPGVNDFLGWCQRNNREDLVEEWDYESNEKSPSDVSYASHYMCGWKCRFCGNRWTAMLKSRTKLGAGCPKCGFKRVAVAQSKPKDENSVYDFCVQHKLEQALIEWNNPDISPHEVCRSSSNAKILWKCIRCGHQWTASPNTRIRVRKNATPVLSSCPMCLKERKTSFPEQAFFYYIKQAFADAINGNNDVIGMELDIYIPSIKTAIEYDGYAWHQDAEKDLKKVRLCKEHGISLIRVREDGCPDLFVESCLVVRVKPNDYESLNAAIIETLGLLKVYNLEVSVVRDEQSILALYQQEKQANSLAVCFPEITKEFHPTKNGSLSPLNLNKKTSRRVWWQCSKCGYEWNTAVSQRTGGLSGCPACSGRALVIGKNDLQTWCKQNGRLDILQEWDYSKNPFDPTMVTKKTGHWAFWICSKCGQSYKQRVASRTGGTGCPFCAGHKVAAGKNDFESWCKANDMDYLLAEWSPQNVKKPSEYSYGSGKKILWICADCQHEWLATLDNRRKGKGCPKCGAIKRGESNRRQSANA